MAKEWKLMIPTQLTEKIACVCHERYDHFGPRKCYQVLRESCIFKNMERVIRRILKVCELCQKSKTINSRQEGDMSYIKSSRPFELVAVDLYGPLPKGR